MLPQDALLGVMRHSMASEAYSIEDQHKPRILAVREVLGRAIHGCFGVLAQWYPRSIFYWDTPKRIQAIEVGNFHGPIQNQPLGRSGTGLHHLEMGEGGEQGRG